MKQFAFPLSVKCASIDERNECTKLLESIGYEYGSVFPKFDPELLIITNLDNVDDRYSTWDTLSNYSNGRHHINHFNPALIRDIAAACTNDTWQEGELWVSSRGKLSRLVGYVGFAVNPSVHRRPTIAEICAHHGYEIKGRDIVKKVETVSNCDKSYCETARQLDEAKAEIKRLKSENADLKEKLEAITDVGNQELARLQRKIDELVNKLQYNDKLHVKELEMLTDTIIELSRDKAELIEKINCLLAPAPAEFNPISCMHALEDRPISLTEREKKRLLRLAERIERLIK